jgi:type I restriction enzyme M protein
MDGFQDKVAFIWSVADLLRGDYKQSEYGRVILPFTVLRRLDCVLQPTKEAVREAAKQYEGQGDAIRDRMLKKAAQASFYNTHKLDFDKLLDDPDNIAANLTSYILAFSPNIRSILEDRDEFFRFPAQIDRLDKNNLLYLIVQKFNSVDLHPDRVSNLEMGYIFEELIRKFSEQSNETAGEHFTPREVIRLMVNLLYSEDDDALTQPGVVRTIFDPACGTGGMLSVSEEYLHEFNKDANVEVFGQELNGESYAICKADMIIKDENPDNVQYGNSFSEDGFGNKTFDYMLSNPPFGVSWKKVRKLVEGEHEEMGFAGRFGAGTPRINDGSLLFLQHMISKMKDPADGGSRIAIVFNASPLFTGSAGSGESEIRKWIIENDWLEAIIGLPDQLFYNTGINTYVWIVTNRKAPERKGKIQLINAVSFYQKMRKSLGDKRHELSDDHIAEIARIYGEFQEGEHCKIFDNEDFGYYRIKVERPLRENFAATPERIERLWDETKFTNLAKSRKKNPEARQADIEEGEARQEEILRVLHAMPDTVFQNRKEFTKAMEATRKELGIDSFLVSPKRAIWSALANPDDDADIVHDTKGRPIADSNLRDYENVPLKQDIEEYFAEEVLPYVPHAWIDEDYTRIGYEIPFTRFFYEYEPPRPLEEIEGEILELESQIQGMLREVLV